MEKDHISEIYEEAVELINEAGFPASFCSEYTGPHNVGKKKPAIIVSSELPSYVVTISVIRAVTAFSYEVNFDELLPKRIHRADDEVIYY